MPLARVDVRIPSRALLRDFKSPKAAFISLSFHHRRVLFRFSAAAQASLHRPAPRTRSRATLIPLLRPLDRRKGLLSHISPVSPTALTCHPARHFRAYCRPRSAHPATPFLPSANLKKPNREAAPVPQCSQPRPPVHQASPHYEASPTGGTLNVRWRQFAIEQPPLI